MDRPKLTGYLVASALLVLLGMRLVAGNLYCYDCRVDVKKSGNSQSSCVYNVTGIYAPRQCQSHERYCKIERVRYNRVIRTFERDCADTCRHACQTRGFGIDEETCVFCCSGDGCNDSASSAAGIERSLGLWVSILAVGYSAKQFED